MDKIEIEYIQTKIDKLTVKVNGFFLHSKYDPIKEAERIVENHFEKGFLHILFGYGLGYIANELKRKLENSSDLLIVDPIFPKLNSISNETGIITKMEKNDIGGKIEKKLSNFETRVKVICSPNYDKIFPKEYSDLLKIIKDIQNFNIVNENTLKFFSDTWQENYIHNLFNVYTGETLKVLYKYYDCPVVVASGGPSLTKQLPLLKKISDKIVIIASGSTVNSLLANDIEPDYIVTIDGSINNYEHFKNLKNVKSQLMYALTSHYKIQDEFTNKKYAFVDYSNIFYKNHIKNIFGIDLPLIAGGGSVANFAFSIASYISSGPIAIVGQDLAYTNKESHAKGNKFYLEIDEKFMKNRKIFETEGYNGDKVLTDYAFYSMKKRFEVINEALEHESQVYNCTEGGAKIEGMAQLAFREFCETYVNEQATIEYFDSSKTELNSNLVEFISITSSHLEIYKELIGKLNGTIKVLNNSKSKVSFDKKTLVKLDKIDGFLEKKLEKVALNYIIDPITVDVLKNYRPTVNERAEEKYNRVLKQNIELYSRLLGAIKKTKENTEDMLLKIKIQ